MTETTGCHLFARSSPNCPQKSSPNFLGMSAFGESKLGPRDELLMWGRNIMMGYLGKPKETSLAFDEEGWFRSGDICNVDEDGDYYILGRIKEMLIVGSAHNTNCARTVIYLSDMPQSNTLPFYGWFFILWAGSSSKFSQVIVNVSKSYGCCRK